MTEFRFTDAVRVGKPRKTRDGYLTARVHAARTGVQDYLASELGRKGDGIVRVYRPEEEVFATDSLGSYKGKPITVGHPGERVTADNHRTLARGHIANVARDGESVALDVAITDAETITAIESAGPRELSAGYVAQIDWTPGTTPAGQKYDAVQRSIFVDHLALVPKGRAGSEFRIGDDRAEAWGASPLISTADQEGGRNMADTLHNVVLGDEVAQVAVADAPKIKAFMDAQKKALTDATAKITDLEKQLETKDGELKATKKSLEDATSPQTVSDAAKARARTIQAGKKSGLAEDDMDKMDDAAIRRAVVAKSLGDDAAKAMSDAAIEGAFAFAAKGVTRTNDAALGGGIQAQDSDPWASFDQSKKGA